MERLPSFEELEEGIRSRTRGQGGKILSTIEKLLNQYSDGFQRIGKFDMTDDNRLEQVWMFLTVRAFNSLRWAYYLLETGYYSQSMMLTRSAFEDWLVCEDCKEHQGTIEAILDGKKRVPKPSTMAKRLEVNLKKEWNDIERDEGIYSLLSTFSHPRYSALAVLLDPETKLIRLGPTYDENLFLVAANYLLLALMRVMEFLIRLVDPIDSIWTVETKPVLDQALECRREVLDRANELLKKSN